MGEKNTVQAMLRKRMAATQQASELELGDEFYEKVFRPVSPGSKPMIQEIPVSSLTPFFTTDIGFKPYPAAKLEAFAKQLAEDGLFERIIVRAIPNSNRYEIIAGHNRTEAAKLNEWKTIPAEIIVADDARATSIAIATNLLRRQELTILERGKAYKALIEAERKQGFRSDIGTSGEIRQKFLTREIVAEFFGVTEYEIRKAVKLTQLIPALADTLESNPKALPLSCADLIAEYDTHSQAAFEEMCQIEGYHLTIATMKHIHRTCPPPTADRQRIYAAWREARAAEDKKKTSSPKKITFDRKKFAPYLEKFGSEKELERLFLEFLKEKAESEVHRQN